MSELRPTDIVSLFNGFFGGDIIDGIIKLSQALEDENERILNRDALRNATVCITRLYESGKLSKQGYLNALDALLECKERNVTIDAEIANKLDKLYRD